MPRYPFKMEVIVIIDRYGYGGFKTIADVVAIPNGKSDVETFKAWARERSETFGISDENVESSFAFFSCEVSGLPKEII